MVTLVRVEGGPHLGLAPVEQPLQATIALGVNERWERDDRAQPYAYAVYELQHHGGEPVYVFREYRRGQNEPVLVEFAGGPKAGIHAMLPAALGPQVRCLLNPDGSLHDGVGPVGGIAIYERQSPGAAGKYVFVSLDDTPQAIADATEFLYEERLNDAINSFYANPYYDIYSTKPTDRHEQVFVQVGHRRAHVDVGIATVIRELFRLGFDTIGSCQEQAQGEAFEGQAYIGFCRERDAKRFHMILDSAGVAATLKPKKTTILTRRSPNAPAEQIEVPSGNVMFPSSEIERVSQLLQSEVSPG